MNTGTITGWPTFTTTANGTANTIFITTDPMSPAIDNFVAQYDGVVPPKTLKDHAAAIYASAVSVEKTAKFTSEVMGARMERLAVAEKLALENAKMYFNTPLGELVWVSSENGARDGHKNPTLTRHGFDLGGGVFARYPGDPDTELSARVFCRCRLEQRTLVAAAPDMNETSKAMTDVEELTQVLLDHSPEGTLIPTEVIVDDDGYSWSGVVAIEGRPTGDGRMIRQGALTWLAESLPLPLQWQEQMVAAHEGAVQVGVIDQIERRGEEIYASGRFNKSETAQRLVKLMGEDTFVPGISVHLDEPKGEVYETEDGVFSEITSARVRGATVVDIPAFIEGRISLEVRNGALVASALLGVDFTIDGNAITASAHTLEYSPPMVEVFDLPAEVGPQPWRVDPDGICSGHIAFWDTPHISFTGQEIFAPRPADGQFDYFHTPGSVVCDGGEVVDVGRLFFAADHADLALGQEETMDHYANSGALAATLRCHATEFGIWASGVVGPDVTPSQIATIRALDVSGDWRRINGKLELVALLSVNVGGFQKGGFRTAYALAASGEPDSLVMRLHHNAPEADDPMTMILTNLASVEAKLEQLSLTIRCNEVDKAFAK